MRPIHNTNIISAIKRYIRYVGSLSEESEYVTYIMYISLDDIHSSEDIGSKKNYLVFAIRDFNQESIVYCLNFTNLQDNIKRALQSKEKYPLLHIPKVRNKIAVFFKGHGKEPLTSNLNKVIYNFRTGLTQVKESPEDFEEFRKLVFTPGFKAWEEFLKRLQKYPDLLIVSGFGTELKKVQENVDLFNTFYNFLQPIKLEKILSLTDEKINEEINNLKNIDILFSKIEKRIKEF